MSIKDELEMHKQILFETITAAVAEFQIETGVKVAEVSYRDSSYAEFPRTHGYGYDVKLKL